jgi:hypothetical protein
MQFSRYMTNASQLSPKALSAMDDAFERTIADLAIGPQDETRRQAVAHYIIDRASEHRDTDAAGLREQAVKALRGLSNGGGIWWSA